MKRMALYVGTLPASQEAWRLRDWCMYSLLKPLVASRPEDLFVLLFSGPAPAGLFAADPNVHCRSLGPVPRRLLSLYRQLNYKWPAVLQQSGSQLLVSLTGVLPLRKGRPACLLLSDGVLSPQAAVPKEGPDRYRRRFLPRFLKQANQLVTLSDFGRQRLMSEYQIPEHRITVVTRGPVSGFEALGWEERQAVKEQYTGGKEYLLYPGDIRRENNIVGLLKAFSVLKKKMRSGMALVLAGALDSGFKKFPELLGTYHFRKDVICTGALPIEERARLMGGAYGCILTDGPLDFTSWVPEALKCRTPLVLPEASVHASIAGPAACCFHPGDVEDMGEQLCRLYRDEELRARLIAAADERLQHFSWSQAAHSLATALFAAAEKTTTK